jgi:hypothetical protein
MSKADWIGLSKTCRRFPHCYCGELWAYWQNRIAEVWESNPPTSAEIDVAETVLFEMLRCVSDCRHSAGSQAAQRQLAHPTFDRQHKLLEERRRRWQQ